MELGQASALSKLRLLCQKRKEKTLQDFLCRSSTNKKNEHKTFKVGEGDACNKRKAKQKTALAAIGFLKKEISQNRIC